jgi:alpha-tubulin suppressor-like RCC1 family protein
MQKNDNIFGCCSKKLTKFILIFSAIVAFGCTKGSDENSPVAQPRKFKSVSQGGSVTCAVDQEDKPFCWGRNDSYQLGLKYSASNSFLRTPQSTLDGVAVYSISANSSMICAIKKSDENIICAGNNNSNFFTLPGLTRASLISLNNGMNCLRDFSAAYCWNTQYPGNGTTTSTTVPVQVNNLGFSQIVSSSTISFGCGLSGSDIYCWGTGYLGNGNFHTYPSPQKVIDSGVQYSYVAAGGHTCGITVGGLLKCWGNTYGDGINTTKLVPTSIDSSTRYVSVSVGNNHACGITDTDQLKCWGDNNKGQIGDGTNITRATPVVIDQGTKYRAVSAGFETTCAITTDYYLKCWGYNFFGQVGNNGSDNQLSPSIVY